MRPYGCICLFVWMAFSLQKKTPTYRSNQTFFFPDDDSADDLLNAFDLLMVNCSTFVVHVESLLWKY